MTKKRKSLKYNFIIYILRTLVVTCSSLLIFPYASRMLGVAPIGKVQYIQSIASYFQLFASFGVTTYGIREGSKHRDEPVLLNKLIIELIVINFICTVISLIAYGLFTALFIPDTYSKLLWVFSVYIIVYGLNFDWYFNIYEQYTYITIRSVIGSLLSLVVVFLFVKSPQNYLIYAVSIVIPYAVSFILNGGEIVKNLTRVQLSLKSIMRHLKPLTVIFSVIVATNVYSLLDSSMLGAMQGDMSVGLYTAASKLTRLASTFVTGIFGVFTPRLTYYIGLGNKEEYRKLATKIARLIMLGGILISVYMSVFSRQLITLYSGEAYLAADPAMKILSINFLFSIVDCYMGWQLLVPNNKESVMLKATIVGSVIDVLLNLLLIPRFNVLGATAATFAAEISVFILLFLNCRHMVKLNSVKRTVLKTLLSVGVTVVGIYALQLNVLNWKMALLVVLPLALIVNLILLYLLKEKTILEVCDEIRSRISTRKYSKNQ
ncbi:flippase [Allobaculum sp.]